MLSMGTVLEFSRSILGFLEERAELLSKVMGCSYVVKLTCMILCKKMITYLYIYIIYIYIYMYTWWCLVDKFTTCGLRDSHLYCIHILNDMNKLLSFYIIYTDYTYFHHYIGKIGFNIKPDFPVLLSKVFYALYITNFIDLFKSKFLHVFLPHLKENRRQSYVVNR
jgi:hypothetical protein